MKTKIALTLILSLAAGTLTQSESSADSASATPASESPFILLPPTTVRAPALGEPRPGLLRETGSEALRVADASELLRTLPGASTLGNGPLTGIAQVRGLSGDRVGVRVNGRAITPACPNHMDPPLHYARPAKDDLLTFHAGVVPVSAGPEMPGGLIRIDRRAPEFAPDGSSSIFSGLLSGQWHGRADAFSALADLSWFSPQARIDYRGFGATADDLRTPAGRIQPSGYDTQSHSLRFSVPRPEGFLSFEAGLTHTRDAGTPALPMDMVEDDSYHFDLRLKQELGGNILSSHLYYHDVDHLMDNFSLRPTPGMRMAAPASSQDIGWRADLQHEREDSIWKFGIDLHRASFEAQQVVSSGPMEGAFRDTFRDNVRQRAGLYAEQEWQFAPQWSTLFGLRADVVETQARTPRNGFGGPVVDADLAAFQTADRRTADLLPDATAALRYSPRETTSLELAAAVRHRAPSLIERYLWTPANASAGMADGRTYLGNPDLDPETSFELALSVVEQQDDFFLFFTPFYRHVENYIQGTPTSRPDMAGNPVLQYQNLSSARLYGFETGAELSLGSHFALDTSLAYVRGRAGSDNLYRISPLHGITGATATYGNTSLRLECEWAARQSKTSAFLGEPNTSGFALAHLRIAHDLPDQGLRLEAGIENLFDKNYSMHTSGRNRVPGNAVPIGERIPSASRAAYVGLSWEF